MDIQTKIKVQAPVDKVFKACSSQNGIQGWWCQNSSVAENLSGISKLTFNKQGTLVNMEFRTDALENGKRVMWTCTNNDNPSWIGTSLNFNFETEGEITLINFSHSGFDTNSANDEMQKTISDTWVFFMNSLKSFCEKGKGQPW